MEGMDNNKKELKESRLMEVTGGAAETDSVPANKEKSSELVPKSDFKTVTCMLCKRKFDFPVLPIKEKTSSMAFSNSEKYKNFEKCRNYVCSKCYEILYPQRFPRFRTMK